ncbi:MAG: MarR family transcriptional regulator [Dehalococcoidales bacterium]|nr:MarR family transcriptional regulator [Dehalococcoidales bacterium]
MREYICSTDKSFNTWALLFQVRDASFRIRNKELAEYGLTFEKATVLSIVNDLRNLKLKTTPGEISKYLLREPHSVSKILSRMEKEGFVKKSAGLGMRKNEVHITLTPKGERALDISLKRLSIKRLMSCLSEEESLKLAILLEKILLKALNEINEDKKSFILAEREKSL